jgi:hypothetical protein
VPARSVLVVLVLLVALVGCTTARSSRPNSQPSGTTSAVSATPAASGSPGPSPSRTGPLLTGPNVRPGEKPPVLAPEGRRYSAAGALIFANYYFRAWDWSIATNDPYLVRHFAGPDCTTCRRVAKRLGVLQAKGDILRGGRITVTDGKVVFGSYSIKSDFVVMVGYKQSRAVVTAPDGSTRQGAMASADNSLIFLTWRRSGWETVEIAAAS